MKVFKMNDYDWVCAESEEQAKQFYFDETGVEYIEEDFKGEVSLTDTMYISLDDLPEEELSIPQVMQQRYGETWVQKTFEWVIKHENITYPCIISSTEY